MPGMDPAVASGDVAASFVGDIGGGDGVSQLAGSFVYGDTGKALIYFVRQNGVPLDVSLAGTIVLKMIRRAGGSDFTVNVPGGPSGSDTSALEFSITASAAAIGTTVPQPASRLAPDVYECRITFTLDGLVYWTDPFRLEVTRWP